MTHSFLHACPVLTRSLAYLASGKAHSYSALSLSSIDLSMADYSTHLQDQRTYMVILESAGQFT